MIYLQERDQNLIRHLKRYGIMSTRQIRDHIFNDCCYVTAMRRLRKLEAARFIRRVEGMNNNISAWCLTQEAATEMGIESVPRYSNRNVIHHEVTLTEVRLSLEKAGLGKDWISEFELRKQMGYVNPSDRDDLVIPDGLFVATKNGKPCMIAVELELTAKNRARYDHIFRRYAQKDSIGYVWYIVDDFAVELAVFNQWKKMNREAGFTLMTSQLQFVVYDPWSTHLFIDDEREFLCEYFDALPDPADAPEPTQGPAHPLSRGVSTRVEIPSEVIP